MKRSWTAWAVALAAIFVVAGCNDYGNTFQNNTGASISFLSPAQISAGGADFVITVNGRGFVTQTVVEWNGKPLKTTPTLDSGGNVLNETATVPAAPAQFAGEMPNSCRALTAAGFGAPASIHRSEAAPCHESRATQPDYHLDGDEVKADSQGQSQTRGEHGR